MYPSKPNSNADASAPSFPTSDEKHRSPPMDNPSAPLLPSSSYNSAPPPTFDPPPYSSVVAQDSEAWKNQSTPYPPAAPYGDASKSTSGFSSQAPYPTGPGLAPGPTGQAPYPTGGSAPYPTGPGSGPELGSNAPYPVGPGLGSAITSQPPYSTESGYIPGPASQAPYPVASMPMPAPVDTNRQIGFTAPVTMEPKPSDIAFPAGGYAQGPHMVQTYPNAANGNQGVIHPMVSAPNGQYVHTPQYAPNQYAQQQPQTIYVVQKTPNQSNTVDDDCAFWACCLASCYCLCECIKACAGSD